MTPLTKRSEQNVYRTTKYRAGEATQVASTDVTGTLCEQSKKAEQNKQAKRWIAKTEISNENLA
uniref:Candidate secreted effector n=1 Tax=Meloidogyne incognita TaxID=6306 RepID=A0A914MD51_MELIC